MRKRRTESAEAEGMRSRSRVAPETRGLSSETLEWGLLRFESQTVSSLFPNDQILQPRGAPPRWADSYWQLVRRSVLERRLSRSIANGARNKLDGAAGVRAQKSNHNLSKNLPSPSRAQRTTDAKRVSGAVHEANMGLP
jgi:hypothetical protein